MVTLMINLEQQVTEGLNKIITELKQRLRERKAELGANHTQENERRVRLSSGRIYNE